MNSTRLMVLGLLASGGPSHGHQIRRAAEVANVGNWGGVSIGALYRELRSMADEGLLEAVRTERVGRRPARTVYQITDDGRRELDAQREKAICELQFGPDPFGVAILFGRLGDPAVLRRLLRTRLERLTAARDGVAAECTRLRGLGYLSALDVALFRRREAQLDAEVHWLEEFTKTLAELPGSAESGGVSWDTDPS